MKIEERAAYVEKRLNEFYPEPPRGFLTYRNPFTLLIAVLLSAQCTDVRVNKVTPALFELADNPFDMAKQSVEKVTELVRTCGLVNRKACAIVELSKILVEKFNGVVPDNFEDLESLPGVGHKTASVVMVQAFGREAFPVDTHIYRLARRWKLSEGNTVEKVEADLKRLFPSDHWGSLHHQIILYGREHCTARGCDGRSCPICCKLGGV